ncbi:MAG: phosphatase PAP2 family protein [Frankiales bacterium]|nr:phosphatase PAP2 family protein [Frankiales bacterium]
MSWLRLDVTTASIGAAALLVAAIALRPLRRRWSVLAAAAAVEIALVCGLFALWQIANGAAHTNVAGGLANGRWVWHAERVLVVPSERWLQRPILPHPDIVRATNYYYDTAHLTGMAIFLAWLWLRHRDLYPRWRNVMVLFTGMSLLIEIIPVAPPRLIGGTGLVDTAELYGQSVYTGVGSGLADQYAALPSIHVGWALLIAVACLKCSSSPWRWIGVAHAVLTVFGVVATANHYWFDGLSAAIVLVFAIGLERFAVAPVRRRLVLRRGDLTADPADDQVARVPVPSLASVPAEE